MFRQRKVGKQITESICLHLGLSKKDALKRAAELLEKVGLPDVNERLNAYPHQLSGGMRQRVMIAMALSCNPKILIADEATTALDVTTQAQILELMKEIVKEMGTTLVIVTHNLSLVARYADRVYVMYAGEIVETGTTEELFYKTKHPYSIGLLQAIPSLTDPRDRKLIPIRGTVGDLRKRDGHCVFMPRCPYAMIYYLTNGVQFTLRKAYLSLSRISVNPAAVLPRWVIWVSSPGCSTVQSAAARCINAAPPISRRNRNTLSAPPTARGKTYAQHILSEMWYCMKSC